MNLMQEYINQQPSILKSIVDDRQQITSKFVELFKKENFDRIVIIGSGSSYNAGLMAKPIIEKSMGIETAAVIPTRMDDLEYVSATKILYCVLSQGGRSTNTLHVIRELTKNKKSVITLTEKEDSPIAQLALVNLTIPIGEENIGAKTKGVTATALILMLAFLELGKTQGSINDRFYTTTIEALNFIIAHMDQNIKRSITWCNEIKKLLRDVNIINIISKGTSLGAAKEGTLKLLETLWKPVTYYEFEEYLHGPENALDEKTAGLLLLPNDDDAQRMINLSTYAKDKNYRFLLIDLKNEHPKPGNLSLAGSNNDYLSSFEYLPPLQTLSAQLSDYLDNDISKPRFPDFYTTMGTKLQ